MNVFWEIVASNSLAVVVLAVGVALLGRIWKNAAGLHLLWMLVLLKLVTPPLLTVPLALPMNERPMTSGQHGANGDVAHAPPAALLGQETSSATAGGLDARALDDRATAGSPAVATDAAAPVARPHRMPWLPMLLWTWAAGVALFTSGHACRILRFRRLLRAAEAPPSTLRSMAEGISIRLGLTRVPEIAMLPVRLSPLVWSIGGRPRVLLPSALFERLDADAQRAVLAHELAHVRRKDHWVRLLELAVATLFWWHPVVWWACCQLRELEEQCCDAVVLGTLFDGPKAYATALLDTLDFLSEQPVSVPLVATGANSPVSLQRRIKMLKNRVPVTRLTAGHVVLLVAVAAGPMALGFAAANRRSPARLRQAGGSGP
jgi:bla regulator protein BlaR1